MMRNTRKIKKNKKEDRKEEEVVGLGFDTARQIAPAREWREAGL
jgi:hypothetical protein